jgi:hypothetical protein
MTLAPAIDNSACDDTPPKQTRHRLKIHADHLASLGMDRNTICAALLKENRASPAPIDEAEVCQLVQAIAPAPAPLGSARSGHCPNQLFPPPAPPNGNDKDILRRSGNVSQSDTNNRPPASGNVSQEIQIPKKIQEGPGVIKEAAAAADLVKTVSPFPLAEDVPFAVHVEAAVAHHQRDRETRPESDWRSPLFEFVRVVKAHPDVRGLTAAKAMRAVGAVFKSWAGRKPAEQRKADDWEFWLGEPRDDAQAEFLAVWDKVRFLPGDSPLEAAAAAAENTPLDLRQDVMERRSDGYPRFVALAGWLQVIAGNRNIMLPVANVGALLGVQPMTVSRYRAWAVEDRYLREMRPSKFYGEGQGGRAAEYRFDTSRFSVFEAKAQRGTAEAFQQS